MLATAAQGVQVRAPAMAQLTGGRIPLTPARAAVGAARDRRAPAAMPGAALAVSVQRAHPPATARQPLRAGRRAPAPLR